MIHKLSQKMTLSLLKRNIFPAEEKEIYEYGFELLISSVIGFLIVFFSGLIFAILPESMLFYIIFVSVRPFSGGYHADTHLRCKLSFITVYASVMFFGRIFAENFNPAYHILILVMCMNAVILYAPVEHPNKPLDEAERLRNRKLCIIITAAISAASIAVVFFSVRFAAIISLTLFSVSILMIIAKFTNEETREKRTIE